MTLFSRSLDQTERRIKLEHSDKELRAEVDELRRRCQDLQMELNTLRTKLASPEEKEFAQSFHPVAGF